MNTASTCNDLVWKKFDGTFLSLTLFPIVSSVDALHWTSNCSACQWIHPRPSNLTKILRSVKRDVILRSVKRDVPYKIQTLIDLGKWNAFTIRRCNQSKHDFRPSRLNEHDVKAQALSRRDVSTLDTNTDCNHKNSFFSLIVFGKLFKQTQVPNKNHRLKSTHHDEKWTNNRTGRSPWASN